MAKTSLEWDEAALERLKKAPFFVRKLAKEKVEKAAIARGEKRVTLALFEQIKQEQMGR